jgi:hypothetical protein
LGWWQWFLERINEERTAEAKAIKRAQQGK